MEDISSKVRNTLYAGAVGLTLIIGLAGCKPDACDIKAKGEGAYMPNPAAAYCENIGGKSVIKADDDGNQIGYCQIDGKEFDEWELYRKDCLKE